MSGEGEREGGRERVPGARRDHELQCLPEREGEGGIETKRETQTERETARDSERERESERERASESDLDKFIDE